jgi:hypothetical protein
VGSLHPVSCWLGLPGPMTLADKGAIAEPRVDEETRPVVAVVVSG